MLRIADANLNRIGEGLRVLEEVARFLLDDASLTQRLKTLRHHLLGDDPALQTQLLSARRADEDVGAFQRPPQERERQDWVALVVANSRRVQESLRVLEELAKIPTSPISGWERFEQARFQVYELEKELVSRVSRKEKQERLRGLYVIVDPEACQGSAEVEVARQAIEGGARVIQLRAKHQEKGPALKVARELKEICANAGVLFIVNDHVDLALAAGADGVHLGQQDLPVAEARRMLPIDRLVGCSTNNLEEALQAQADGADYVAVGSIFPTASKSDTRPAGLEVLRQVKAAVSLPVVAIGGINLDNVAKVMAAGADGVAVISAVVGADDIKRAAQEMVRRMEAG